jgi:hypothetical protein
MIQRLQTFAWDGGHMLEGLVDAVRWPFERAAWAIERGLVWQLEERAGGWSPRTRIVAVVALAVLAVGAGTLGLVLASGGSGGTTQVRQAAAPPPAPVAEAPAAHKQAHAAPILQGAQPNFRAEADHGVAKGSAEATSPAAAATAVNSTSEVATSAHGSEPGAGGQVAGPVAIKVARQFSGAFVLYETGKVTPEVRQTFEETATPQLTRELLRRPPRLPAGVKVPQAKVLNVVPGPHQGDTYTVSASLLRVGITSELRLDMQRDEKTHEWLVSATRG